MPHTTQLVTCLGAERNYKTYIISKNRNTQRLILVALFVKRIKTRFCKLQKVTGCGLDFNKIHSVLTKLDFLYICLLNKVYHDYYNYK